MHLNLSLQSAEHVARGMVTVSLGTTQVWPSEQPIQQIADPRILGTRFQDSSLLQGPMQSRILAQADLLPANKPSWGGKKVRDLETWNMTEMQLVTQRALLFFCRALQVSEAHVVDRWANVMAHGEFNKPHSHYDVDAAVVLFLESGAETASDSVGGDFEIIDSRIPFCCTNRPGRPTRGIMPAMAAGTMLLFPAEFLHYVHPYHGRRPRITLAWNISAGPPPERPVANFSEQQPGIRDVY